LAADEVELQFVHGAELASVPSIPVPVHTVADGCIVPVSSMLIAFMSVPLETIVAKLDATIVPFNR
jgi:hypothetical protein